MLWVKLSLSIFINFKVLTYMQWGQFEKYFLHRPVRISLYFQAAHSPWELLTCDSVVVYSLAVVMYL